jgi:serine/threonine protein kinase
MKHMKTQYQLEALQEVQILRTLSHPNIIKYYSSFFEHESLYILMEYAAGGDLYAVCEVMSLIELNVVREGAEEKEDNVVGRRSVEICAGNVQGTRLFAFATHRSS